MPQAQLLQTQHLRTKVQEYSGVIPPPDLLQQFDAYRPGTGARLIQWAEDEQLHRRAMDAQAQAANIELQMQHLALAKQQQTSEFESDRIGQLAGLVVCVLCVCAAAWLGSMGHTAVPVALAAVPSGAIVLAFRNKLSGRRQKPQD